jgi:hypothetical protein
MRFTSPFILLFNHSGLSQTSHSFIQSFPLNRFIQSGSAWKKYLTGFSCFHSAAVCFFFSIKYSKRRKSVFHCAKMKRWRFPFEQTAWFKFPLVHYLTNNYQVCLFDASVFSRRETLSISVFLPSHPIFIR